MLLSEMAARLASEGLVPAGYTVTQGMLSDTPDKQIALFETGGAGPQVFFGGPSVEQPALRVWVRGAARDYNGPRLVAEAIYQAMLGWGAFTASGVRYLSTTLVQAPYPYARDGNERVVVAFTAWVRKELSPTA